MKTPYRFAVLAMLSVAVTGCQSFRPGMQRDAAHSLADEQTAAPAASYFIDVQSDWFGTKTMSKPFREGMTVQDAVEQSGALMTMRAVEVDLIRQEGPQLVKMPCTYNVSERHIEYNQDYAMRAHDRVVIRPRKTNILDSTLKSLGGAPLR